MDQLTQEELDQKKRAWIAGAVLMATLFSILCGMASLWGVPANFFFGFKVALILYATGAVVVYITLFVLQWIFSGKFRLKPWKHFTVDLED